jgi:hypothetical protein
MLVVEYPIIDFSSFNLISLSVVLCEGGSIALFGWMGEDGKWHFLRETDEGTLMDMMSKDDQEGLCFFSKTEAVTGWIEALKLFNKYPSWPCMFPLFVHPEFADRVSAIDKTVSAQWVR